MARILLYDRLTLGNGATSQHVPLNGRAFERLQLSDFLGDDINGSLNLVLGMRATHEKT